jgi:hypothetical protein
MGNTTPTIRPAMIEPLPSLPASTDPDSWYSAASVERMFNRVTNRLNAVIEAVNNNSVILDALKTGVVTEIECKGCGDIAISKASWPGFRPLHIEDGHVKEESAFSVIQGEVVPPKGGYSSNWDCLYSCSVDYPDPRCPRHNRHNMGSSVPEAEPQEQELAFEKALNRLQNTVATLAVSKCMNTPAGFAEIAECRQAVWFAAHPDSAQPICFSQDDVDLLKAMPDSGDWRQAEGYGSINDGALFLSLIERLQACVPAAQPGKGV